MVAQQEKEECPKRGGKAATTDLAGFLLQALFTTGRRLSLGHLVLRPMGEGELCLSFGV